MKELIGKLLAALPLYSRQMTALLLNPKKFILEQELESDSALQQALTFLAVSFGIAFIAQIPFIHGGQDKELVFGFLAIVSALTFVLNVALLIFSWKIVGGRLAWKKMLVATCYFSSVSTLLSLAFCLLGEGCFKLLDPVLYQQVLSGITFPDTGEIFHSAGYVILLIFNGVACCAVYLWIVLIWGAYRQLMQLNKLRSAIALFVFTVFSPFLLLAQLLMTYVILPANGTPPVPSEVIGQWQAGSQREMNGFRTNYSVTYSFTEPRFKMIPAGDFKIEEKFSADSDKCSMTRTTNESGWAVVHGSVITLTPYFGYQLFKDGCSGRSWGSKVKLNKIEYQYKINQQPAGWTLCMSGRYGQFCLLPKP
jgi:hypothetical protein